jgi:hypothetical protein
MRAAQSLRSDEAARQRIRAVSKGPDRLAALIGIAEGELVAFVMGWRDIPAPSADKIHRWVASLPSLRLLRGGRS